MRKLALLAVALVCSGLWAFAQSTSSDSATGQSSGSNVAGTLKIEGCLGGTDGVSVEAGRIPPNSARAVPESGTRSEQRQIPHPDRSTRGSNLPDNS